MLGVRDRSEGDWGGWIGGEERRLRGQGLKGLVTKGLGMRDSHGWGQG